MMKYLKLITVKKLSVLTSLLFFVGILMSCESPFEEIITKNDDGSIEFRHTIRKEDGQKHGIYQIYYSGQLSEEGLFADDKQEGARVVYYPNGQKQVEETYSNNKVINKKDYYENGNLKSEGQYDKAVTMDGEWKYYYKNGPLKEIINFKNSIEDGIFKEYYENGNIKTEGTYVPINIGIETEEAEQGELKEYNEQGELIRIKQCETGSCKVTWEQNLE